jgi:mRNA-degrading endonuclease YafQ of YafQ-DinJ toxin-antitoxin module
MRVEQTAHFRRRSRKLSQRDAALVATAIQRLQTDPRDPRLQTHKLGGSNRWASSYAANGRIVFTWQTDVITLLDVGTHDEVY